MNHSIFVVCVICALVFCCGCPTVQPINDIPKEPGDLTIALVPENDPAKAEQDEYLDRDVMMDNVSDKLGQYFRIISLKDLEEARAVEAAALGTSAHTDPGAYHAAKFNEVDIMVYLWVKADRGQEPSGDYSWHATIGTRGVRRPSGEELWKFQLRSGDRRSNDRPTVKPTFEGGIVSPREARAQAIKSVALAIAEEIMERVQNRKQLIAMDAYTIKFAGFSDAKRDKIERAMLSLENKSYLKIEKGGSASGDQVTYRVKWLHNEDSQETINSVIEGYCRNHEVSLESTYSATGSLIFQPK